MHTNKLLKTAQCDLKPKQKYKSTSLGHDTVRSKFTCIFLLFPLIFQSYTLRFPRYSTVVHSTLKMAKMKKNICSSPTVAIDKF